jgi:hypothetical protein
VCREKKKELRSFGKNALRRFFCSFAKQMSSKNRQGQNYFYAVEGPVDDQIKFMEWRHSIGDRMPMVDEVQAFVRTKLSKEAKLLITEQNNIMGLFDRLLNK